MGWSLRTKWSLVVVVAALAPLAATAWWSTRVQERGLSRAEAELQIAVVDQVQAEVVRSFDDATRATRGVASTLTDGRVESDELRLAAAKAKVADTPELGAVAIYGPDGAYIDAIAKVGFDATSPPRVEPTAANLWAVHGAALTYLVPMDAGGERRGYALARVDPSALARGVAQIGSDRFHANDRVLVVDADGVVVAGPPSGPFAVGTSLRGRDLFVAQVMRGDTFRNPYASFSKYDVDGVATVGTVRTLPAQDLAVIVRRPEAEAFAELADSRRAYLGAAVAAGVLALLFGLWMAARTTAPVRRLEDLTRAFGEGHLDARSDVRTGDELETLGVSMNEMAAALERDRREIAERTRVTNELSRYMPREVADRIAEQGDEALAGRRRSLAVLFADVASFTPFAESAPPEHVAAFLDELFALLTEIVYRHDGMVDKFIGDCVMALFVEGDGASPPARALAAAEDMHRFVEAAAAGWKERFGVDVRLGIGLSAGDALVGNLGSETRREYTAIGDVVNVASRLEALAQPGQTLCTPEVARGQEGSFSFESLGEQPIRGKRALVEVIQVLS